MQHGVERPKDFYDTTGTQDWTDDDGEIRELTAKDFATMTPFAQLPADLQDWLLQVKHATIRPDLLASGSGAEEKVALEISKPIVDRFKAQGAGWESKVDAALLEWLEQNKDS